MKDNKKQELEDEAKPNNELAVSLSKEGDLSIFISSQDPIEKSKKKAEDLIRNLRDKESHKKTKYIS